MDAEGIDFERQVAGIASLNEPVRRALYQYVVSRGGDVSRDEAARAVGITRSLAVFHLDKLVEEGLLEVRYQRLTGRTGPGAGRPSKLYRRSARQLDVSLPPRSYELAARLFARAIDDAGSTPLRTHLDLVARRLGASLGARAQEALAGKDDGERRQDAAEEALRAYGYEPFHDAAGALRLRNCPFHSLAAEYRQLVCGMNLSLMTGLAEGLGMYDLQPVLDPRPGMCCVAFCRRPST